MIKNKFLLTYFQWARPIYFRLHPRYWPFQAKYRQNFPRPQVIFMSGMPRSGTTLGKRYLGDHEQLQIVPWGHFYQAWSAAQQQKEPKIIVDKNNKNLTMMPRIYQEYGNQAAYLGIVRDPRDELISLLESGYDPEIPRDERFWTCWLENYSAFLAFGRHHQGKKTMVALVRYEDMALSAVETKQSFLEWIGLEGEVDLDTSYHTTIEKIAQKKNPTEDWKAHQVNEVHDHSVGRWRTADGELAELFQGFHSFPAVVSLMALLGYGDTLGAPDTAEIGVKVLGFGQAGSK